jgi:hypothetical protein
MSLLSLLILFCYETQPFEIQIDTHFEPFPCDHNDDNACIVLIEIGYCVINPPIYTNISTMFFDDFKS